MGIHESIKNLGIKMNGIAPAGDTARDQLNSLGSTLTGTTIKGRTIADAINDIADAYIAPVKLTINPVIDDTDLLGKIASDLQENILINNNEITGLLKYVSDYTGFSSDPNLQAGNYIAIKAISNIADAVITAEVVGGISGAVTLDADGIFVAKIANTTQKIQFVASANNMTKTYTLNLTNLELEEAPIILNPFVVGEYLAGIDFGNAVNGERSEAIEAFLQEHISEEYLFLATFGENDDLMVSGDTISLTTSGMEAGLPIYSITEQTIEGIHFTVGWQNLTNGKYLFEASEQINSVSEATGWNGELIGAIIGEEPPTPPTPPTPSLTPFSVGDTFSDGDKIYFDTEADIATFLQGLTYEQGQCALVNVEVTTTGSTFSGVMLMAGTLGTAYVLAGTKNGDTPVFFYSTEAVPDEEIEQGWQNVESDGSYTFDFSDSSTESIAITSVSDAQGWNGVIVGKQEE